MDLNDLVKKAREFRAKDLDGDHLVLMASVLRLATRKPGYLLPVMGQDLSNDTGIPRETTRRKLRELADVGLVEHLSRGVLPADPAMWTSAK